MKWYEGTVGSAIQKALTEKKLFIVYVEGEDVDSKKMETTWDCEKVSLFCTERDFVAIKVKKGSVEFEQFSKCYPVLCIPSTYLINQLGVPVDILPGYLEPHSFLQRIESSVHEQRKHLMNIAGGGSLSDSNTDNVLESKSQTTQLEKPLQSKLSAEEENPELQSKIVNAKSLIQQKRKEREALERKEQIENEKKRRAELSEKKGLAKQKQMEKEMQKIARDQAMEKAEAKAAREAIRQKILQDKLEKAAKYEAAQHSKKMALDKRVVEENQAKQQRTENLERKTSRIQFRFPDGSVVTKEYLSCTTLHALMESLIEETNHSYGKINLATVYPKRQFDEGEMNSTLKDLDLVPSAVLIVLPQRVVTPATTSGGLLAFLMFVLAPVISLLMYLRSLLPGTGPAKESSERDGSALLTHQSKENTSEAKVAKKSKGPQDLSTYEKEGNVYKFKQDDDDDEKKTWNGNSTQQM